MNRLLDEMHSRLSDGSIRLDLVRQGDGWAKVVITTRDGYQFEALVMTPVPKP